MTTTPQPAMPQGWQFKRNEDGSVGIFAPPPKPGESQRTSHVVYPSQSPDLLELLGKLADQQAAAPAVPQGLPSSAEIEELADLLESTLLKLANREIKIGQFPVEPICKAASILQKLAHSLNASPSQEPAAPEIDYQALIRTAYAKDKKWAQGTNGCVAFARGAEWFRAQMLAALREKEKAK